MRSRRGWALQEGAGGRRGAEEEAQGSVGREVQALALGRGVWSDVFQKLPVFLLESSYSGVLVKVNVIGDMSSGRCRWGKGGKETLVGCHGHHWGSASPSMTAAMSQGPRLPSPPGS